MSYDNYLAVDQETLEGKVVRFPAPRDFARVLYEWKFNIRFQCYTFRNFFVREGTLPGERIDGRTNIRFHSMQPPDPANVVDENAPEAAVYVQKFMTTRDITDNTMRAVFEGYDMFRGGEDRGDRLPGEQFDDALEAHRKRSYPIYSRQDFENFDWATPIVLEYLVSLYSPHYLERIGRTQIERPNPTRTWNNIPLFAPAKFFGSVMFEGKRTFGSAMFEGVELDPPEEPTLADQLEATCIPRIIDKVFQNSFHKRAARKFIMNHVNKGVTLDEFGAFIESLGDVRLMVFGPMNSLIYHYQPEQRKHTIACKMVDDHLYLIEDPGLKARLARRDLDVLKSYGSLLRAFHDDGGGTYMARAKSLPWDKAEFTLDPKSEIFQGEKRLILYEEGTISCVDTGGMEMAGLMRTVMLETRKLIENVSFDKKGPDIFQVPTNDNIVVRVRDFEDRKELMELLRYRMENKQFPRSTSVPTAFHWHNHTYTQIGKLIYHALGFRGERIKSTLRQEQADVLNTTFRVTPMQDCLVDEKERLQFFNNDSVRTFDCVRNYASILYKQKYWWNVFNEFTECLDVEITDVSQIGPGEYFVKGDFHLAHPGMKIRQGFYPSDFILECIDHGFIRLDQLTRYLRADYHLPADHFKEFVEYVYALPDPRGRRHKELVNFFLGDVARVSDTISQSFVTDNCDVMNATVNEVGTENCNVYALNEPGDLRPIYLIRVDQHERLHRSGFPIIRQVYCMSWIYLSKLWSAVALPETRLLSFKSDAITIYGKYLKPELHTGPKTIEDLGKIHEENVHLHHPAREPRRLSLKEQEQALEKVMKVMGDKRPRWKPSLKRGDPIDDLPGLLISGPGGSGKTYLMAELMRKYPNHVALCFQNVACANLREQTKSSQVFTFDSYFENTDLDVLDPSLKTDKLKELSEVELVFVDEYGQVPPDKYCMLYQAWIKSNGRMRVFLAGDVNQTVYIGPSGSFRYNYSECALIKLLCCGNKLELDYLDGTTRCDGPLRSVLNFFLKHRRLDPILEHYPPVLAEEDRAFVITRYKRKENEYYSANAIWQRRRPDGKFRSGIWEFINHEDGEKRRHAADLVICNVNKKDAGKRYNGWTANVYNGNTYRINHIDAKEVTLIGVLGTVNECTLIDPRAGEGITVPASFFHGKTNGTPNFEQFVAQTVYRTQGMTLEPSLLPIIHIRGTEGFTFEEMYTALSRARTLDQLRVEYTNKVFKRALFNQKSVSLDILQKPRLGRIYQLVDPFQKDEDEEGNPLNVIYVGQTERTIEEEFDDIKNAIRLQTERPIVKYLREMRQNIEYVEVELIEEFPFYTRRQLLNQEKYWIQKRAMEGHPLQNTYQLPKETEVKEEGMWTTPVLDAKGTLDDGKSLFRGVLYESDQSWKVSHVMKKGKDIVRAQNKNGKRFERSVIGISFAAAVKDVIERTICWHEENNLPIPQESDFINTISL